MADTTQNHPGAFGLNGHVYFSSAGLSSKLVDLSILLEQTKWVQEDSIYTYAVEVSGVSNAITPIIVLDDESDDAIEAYTCLTDAVVETGKIIFKADTQPKVDLSLVVKGVVANRYNAIQDLKDVVKEIGSTDISSVGTTITEAIENENTTIDKANIPTSLSSTQKVGEAINSLNTNLTNTLGFTGTKAEAQAAITAGTIKEGMLVNITDDYNDDGQTALQVSYDNTSSGMSAETVQSAIDEVNTNLDRSKIPTSLSSTQKIGESISQLNENLSDRIKCHIYEFSNLTIEAGKEGVFDTDFLVDLSQYRGFSITMAGAEHTYCVATMHSSYSYKITIHNFSSVSVTLSGKVYIYYVE